MKTKYLENSHFVNEFRVDSIIRLDMKVNPAIFSPENRNSIQHRHWYVNTGELLASWDGLVP